MQTHADITFHYRVTLAFHCLTSTSELTHVTEFPPSIVCLPTLLLIAQAVFLLERGQTVRQTDHAQY